MWLTGKQMYKIPRQFAAAYVDGDLIASKQFALSDDEDGLEGQIVVYGSGTAEAPAAAAAASTASNPITAWVMFNKQKNEGPCLVENRTA